MKRSADEDAPADDENTSAPKRANVTTATTSTATATPKGACAWQNSSSPGFAALAPSDAAPFGQATTAAATAPPSSVFGALASATPSGFGALASAAPSGFGALASAAPSGFGALASAAPSGFGALASAAPSGFAAFASSAHFGDKPAHAPAAAAADNDTGPSTAAEPQEAPPASETELAAFGGATVRPPATEASASITGEEDEDCVYRVRAKLFQLETREVVDHAPSAVPPLSECNGPGDDDEDDGGDDGGGEGGGDEGGGERNSETATEPVAAAGAVRAPAAPDSAAAPASPAKAPAETDVPASASSLNPTAAPFVPASAPAPASSEGAALEARWVERGVGQLRLLLPKAGRNDGANYPRLVMRVENVGRLILNCSLLPSTRPPARVSETNLRLAFLTPERQTVSYLLRVKTPAEASALISAIETNIPSGR